MAPVVRWMQGMPRQFRVRVAVTAQHRQMLDQALAVFRIRPDFDLNIMAPGQTLAASASRILAALREQTQQGRRSSPWYGTMITVGC